ncbi:pimeloyl-ACP methyl ester carboxylesterase [Sphingomonas sp. SORGH_AS802]|uniref:alpha/beta fold hydrolase n=1 Tax=unclassified Sphingomonas TaxID=196159 RepID=UPI00285A5D8F|nr:MULTISPECIES: alpha/beta hydrolase [unclassified Sphingomonas]MDR6128410.1 pimeloyl-ACP methyl ester carboxylesterase [Sphingomonas sp. SORGH_AS_0438]MDR6135388.1 pimeloyl-ACP methyl ester carboxylesterase [Sphingomonas sp. SORGH_AS_0802]
MTTDDLEIAYADHGDPGAPVVLLLHGWPDDASTWDEVIPALTAAGLRAIVPSLRGFGATRFRNRTAPRTGDSAILALDAIALLDRLGIGRFMVAGHDWGSNIAEALAVGWPERVQRMAMLSTPPRLGGMATPPFEQAQRQWYHWFMATARGARAVRDDPKGFAHIHWTNWSPPGWFDEALFERVSRAFDNPDWVAVTLHSYRARWDEADPDPRGRWLAEAVKATATLALPTLYIQGDRDGVNPPSASKDVRAKFRGPFAKVHLAGVGHFPQREDPAAVARHLVRLFTGDPATLSPLPSPVAPAEPAMPSRPAVLATTALVAAAAIGVAVYRDRRN